jgi:ribosomal protein S18 acetylase RimI-like enzyme
MSGPIEVVAATEQGSAIDVIVLAFSADPAARWTWPDAHAYLEHFPRFARAFGGAAFTHASAYCVADHSGAALWLPPGVEPDESALVEIVTATAPGKLQADIFAVLEAMGRHHPSEPHWYLPLIGVDPSRQGRGYGSALMRHALLACDRDGTLAYLESSNPKNVPLYERHGFEVLGTIQEGSSPTIYPMLRKPRSTHR